LHTLACTHTDASIRVCLLRVYFDHDLTLPFSFIFPPVCCPLQVRYALESSHLKHYMRWGLNEARAVSSFRRFKILQQTGFSQHIPPIQLTPWTKRTKHGERASVDCMEAPHAWCIHALVHTHVQANRTRARRIGSRRDKDWQTSTLARTKELCGV